MATLQTVTDFDFEVGNNMKVVSRVSEVPQDITRTEVDVIIWLILEQEFRKAKRKHEIAKQKRKISSISTRSRTQYDGLPGIDEDDGDETDRPMIFNSILNANIRIAREHAEQTLLQEAGISKLWPDLDDQTRESLVLQCCKKSEILKDNSSLSVEQIFANLRSLKFQTQFSVEKRLGQGEYGEVFLATRRDDASKQLYAVKRIIPAQLQIDDIKAAVGESRILKILNGHKNIVEMYDHWLEIEASDRNTHYTSSENTDEEDEEGPLKFYIQLTYCTLSFETWKENNFKNNIKPEKPLILSMALQIFDGIAHIHRHGILHLDINPKNILWEDDTYTNLKIVDFGLAVFGQSHAVRAGTLGYVAPESPLTQKSDVYSAAVTIIAVAKTIYTMAELQDTKERKDVNLGIPGLDEFLTAALDEDPAKRPNAIDIVNTLSSVMHLSVQRPGQPGST